MTTPEFFEESIEAGKKFLEVFYPTLDNNRSLTHKFYVPESVLIWNGNKLTGKAEIEKFLSDVMPNTKTQVLTANCQPIPKETTNNKQSIMVTCYGNIRHGKEQNQPFTSSFVLSEVGDHWKVLSEVFRYQKQPLNEVMADS